MLNRVFSLRPFVIVAFFRRPFLVAPNVLDQFFLFVTVLSLSMGGNKPCLCFLWFFFKHYHVLKEEETFYRLFVGDSGNFDSWFLYSNWLSSMESSVVYLSS